METQRTSKYVHVTCVFLMAAVLAFPCSFARAVEPELANYTSYPIFLSNSVTPNIMIMLDNSGSMNQNAYGTYPGDSGTVSEPYEGEPDCESMSIQVSDYKDDAEEYVSGGYTWRSSSDLDLASSGGSPTYVGIRFQNVNIPSGKTITKAYIQFTGRIYSGDYTGATTNLTIKGQASDNAAYFEDVNYNISSRPTTSASVAWANVPDWAQDQRDTDTQSPDVSAIIQEIVDRSGWSSGNSLAFIISGTGKRDIYAGDGGSAYAPVLHIEYEPKDCVTYYGYFDPTARYTYDSQKFVRDANGSWSGNWLNWASMRRIDVARKVLMGGLATARTGGGNQTLYGETPSQSYRIFYRWYDGDTATPYHGKYKYKMEGGYIKVYDTSGALQASHRIAVQKDSTAEPDDFVDGNLAGILQKVGDKANWGNMWFYTGTGTGYQGGRVSSIIGGNMTDMVTDLQNTGADTWTPLAEAFYVCTRYFAQEAPQSGLGYSTSAAGPYNDTRDPYYQDGELIQCAKSFVILLTDGASTKDGQIPANLKDFDGDGHDNTACNENDGSNCDYATGGTDFLDDVALYARTTDLRSDLDGDQNLILYTIYAFGNEPSARSLLRDAARNGGFDDKNGNNRPDGDYTSPADERTEWDENGDGDPDTYFEASDGYKLEAQLLAAITDILKRASSGTAVSVLATSSEGEGTLTQAYFKPAVTVIEGTTSKDVTWVGYLHTLWVDSQGRTREDSSKTGTRPGLDIYNDAIVDFFFDSASNQASFYRYELDGKGEPKFTDTNGNGLKDATESYVYTVHPMDDLEPIWEAGKILNQRDASTRVIYTYADLDNDGLVDSGEYLSFDTGHSTTLKPFLGVRDATAWSYLGTTTAEDRASNLIRFIRGDESGYAGTVDLRFRKINGANWKLGDIVESTPITVGKPIESYHLMGSTSYFAYLKKQKDREQVVYVGSNDGMLHAFFLGKYVEADDDGTSATESIFFTKDAGTTYGYGDEMWSYIPQALLPHLKFLADPAYTHVYYVDLKPRVVDAQIFFDQNGVQIDENHVQGWGTILLGGLNFGGKAIWSTEEFPDQAGVDSTRNFYSCIFAIDVTDPHNPNLLWEFSSSELGLTTSQPTIAKLNDHNYAVIGSGPTTYEGTSTQTAKVFILDLKTGQRVKTFTGSDNNAFMASPVTVDYGLNFSTDVGYVGQTHASGGSWLGKVYRIRFPKTSGDWRISASDDVYDTDPDHWALEEIIDTDGPVSAPVAPSVDSQNNIWLYWGTGRYFSESDKLDLSTQYFYGLKDPYYNAALYATQSDALGVAPSKLNLLDTTAASVYTDLTVAGIPSVSSWAQLVSKVKTMDGWYLELGQETANIGERVLNKPTVLGGIVFSTTFVPNSDPCGYSGTSNLLGLYYLTGTPYYIEVFFGSNTNVDVGGETKTKVAGKVSLGTGKASGMKIHVGKQTGATGYVQQSTGIVEDVAINPPLSIRSGMIYWRER